MTSAQAQTSYDRLLQLLAADMQSVDQVIRRRLKSEVSLVEQVADYIIFSGGKRMRPALVCLCSKVVGEHLLSLKTNKKRVEADVWALASIVEFIHTATLLHDDVVDESGMRRSRETANAIFGNAASVLVGDFLYSRAFQMMVELGSLPVMAVLAEATNVIAEGEVLQLMNCQDPDVDEARYLQVIRFKTAKLFEASCCLPAVIEGTEPALIKALAAYGRHLGTAFQLVDDWLDYNGEAAEMGKQLGDDLREGKPTLPLIVLLREGSAAQQAAVRSAIQEPDGADIEALLAMVRASGALDTTRQAAEREAGLAQAALAPLVDSVFKTHLLDLASFVVTRRH